MSAFSKTWSLISAVILVLCSVEFVLADMNTRIKENARSGEYSSGIGDGLFHRQWQGEVSKNKHSALTWNSWNSERINSKPLRGTDL